MDFLRARLDEDEVRQRNSLAQWHAPGCASLDSERPFPCDCGVPARVLAEVAAKRERIRLWNGLRVLREGGGHEYDLAYGTATKSLQLDAAVYSAHPDYDERWRP